MLGARRRPRSGSPFAVRVPSFVFLRRAECVHSKCAVARGALSPDPEQFFHRFNRFLRHFATIYPARSPPGPSPRTHTHPHTFLSRNSALDAGEAGAAERLAVAGERGAQTDQRNAGRRGAENAAKSEKATAKKEISAAKNEADERARAGEREERRKSETVW